MPLSPTVARIGRAALAGILACAALAQLAAAEGAPARHAAAVAAGRQLLDALEPQRAARIRELIADPEQVCLPAAAAAMEDSHAPAARSGAPAALAAAAGALHSSPVGAWLLGQAVARGVLICLDPATRLAAYYYAQPRLIGVQASLAPAARTLYLAHELAHVPQHPRYSNDRSFSVEDLLLMHRLREATAEAIATRALWQMRERGHAEPWRAKLATGYGDIARAFAAAMAGAAADGGGSDEPELRATRAAFDQWFAAPLRLQQYDGHMLDHVERIAQDRLGLPPPQRRLSEAFLRGLARYAGPSFLGPGAPPPTGADYRTGLSAGNAARLARIFATGARDLAGAAAADADAAAPPGP